MTALRDQLLAGRTIALRGALTAAPFAIAAAAFAIGCSFSVLLCPTSTLGMRSTISSCSSRSWHRHRSTAWFTMRGTASVRGSRRLDRRARGGLAGRCRGRERRADPLRKGRHGRPDRAAGVSRCVRRRRPGRAREPRQDAVCRMGQVRDYEYCDLARGRLRATTISPSWSRSCSLPRAAITAAAGSSWAQSEPAPAHTRVLAVPHATDMDGRQPSYRSINQRREEPTMTPINPDFSGGAGAAWDAGPVRRRERARPATETTRASGRAQHARRGRGAHDRCAAA